MGNCTTALPPEHQPTYNQKMHPPILSPSHSSSNSDAYYEPKKKNRNRALTSTDLNRQLREIAKQREKEQKRAERQAHKIKTQKIAPIPAPSHVTRSKSRSLQRAKSSAVDVYAPPTAASKVSIEAEPVTLQETTSKSQPTAAGKKRKSTSHSIAHLKPRSGEHEQKEMSLDPDVDRTRKPKSKTMSTHNLRQKSDQYGSVEYAQVTQEPPQSLYLMSSQTDVDRRQSQEHEYDKMRRRVHVREAVEAQDQKNDDRDWSIPSISYTASVTND